MSNRSLVSKHTGAVDGTSAYQVIGELANRKVRHGTFRCINHSAGTVLFRVSIADDGYPWEQYGTQVQVVPGGVDTITTEWHNDNVRLEATGSVPGQVSIEEITPVEAYNTLGD